MLLEGVYTALITPFTEAGDLDTEALTTLVRHVVDGGGEGIVPLGTTGEGYAVDAVERAEVLRAVREAADESTGLIAGATASSTRETIRNAALAAELGYDAIMVAPPPYALPNGEELAAHYRAVAREVGLPVVLYDFPIRTGVSIDWRVLDALVDEPGIVGVKEASGDLLRAIELRNRYGDRYELVCGADPLILDFVMWGACSWIAGAAGFLPRECSNIFGLAVSGEQRAARDALEELLPMMLSMEHGGYLQKVRAGTEAQGLPAGYPRAPLQRLAESEAEEFAAMLVGTTRRS
jgi:4-hydroxy-tetrahydrodipicolinate synthase